jgi:hypothetical protein
MGAPEHGFESPASRAMNADKVDLKNSLAKRIADFLTEIGIEVVPARLSADTFLPGIAVENGRILVDEEKLIYPGDLLHEAGHLALAPPDVRSGLSGEVILPDANMDLVEATAIAWSYAASLHLGLDPKTVFHEGGYRGQSAALLMNFEVGVPLGVNGLQEAGMTMIENAAREGVRPYPHMLKWLRD